MKAHTNNFKNDIKEFGRQLNSKITYTLNNQVIELGPEQLNSVTPHYESAILKSVMKQLDIDSNVDIPVGTVVNYKFGLLVGNNYEYLNYGNYIVYSSERQEDTRSYSITCYDKMLYSMRDYEALDITYPITIRSYINAICGKLGLVFKNYDGTFANYDKEIDHELYLDDVGNSLGYKYRDVLDELAQVTASTICINENDDELEIRYINDTQDVIDEEYLRDINVTFGQKYGPINSIVLSRSAGADNVYLQDDESVADNGLCEIKIKDNQIMNFEDRSDYLPDILDQLNGLEYYLNDYVSTGICYYDLCDKYGISIGQTTYSCIMFNNELDVTQGVQELVNTPEPEETETDYSKANKTDRSITITNLTVNKQKGEISALISRMNDATELLASLTLTVDGLDGTIRKLGGNNLVINSVGFYGLDRYTTQDTGVILTGRNELFMNITDSEAGFIISDDKITHDIIPSLVIGKEYTITFKYFNDEDNELIVKFYNGNDEITLVDETEQKGLSEVIYTFIASSNVYYSIESISQDNSVGGITDLIIKGGDNRSDWQSAPAEITGTNISIYYNGLEISSPTEEIKTVMNNIGFSILTNNGDIMVTVNKDRVLLGNTEIRGDLKLNSFIWQEMEINYDTHLLLS